MDGRWFKDFFRQNPQHFNKIKPGFRVNKLTEEAALLTAKSNYKNSVIKNQVNLWIDIILNQINENISESEKNGKTHDEALASALIDSFFSENIDLYLKITGQEPSDDQLENIKKNIKAEQEEREKSTVFETKLSEYEHEIEKLKNELNEAIHDYFETCSKKDRTISDITRQNKELTAQIDSLNEEIAKIKSRKVLFANETTDEQHCLLLEDKIPLGLPDFNSEEIVSLCEVYIDYNDSVWLNRYADINHKGEITAFHKNEFSAPLFSNRDKLYYKSGPSKSGTIAVWNWSTVPNINDSSKDYVFTEHNPLLIPIEITIITEFSSIDQIVDALKSGYSFSPRTGKIIIAISTGKDKYCGILCNNKDLVNNSGIISFSDSLTQVPVYEFSVKNILKFENGKTFLNKIYAGIPNRVYHIKTPIEIVKDIVLNSISWANYKLCGIAKTEYRDFKECISSIPTETVIEKICKACLCSEDIASELYEQFLCSINNHIDGRSLEDAVISTALQLDETLMNRAKSLLKDEWEKENADIISQAKVALKSINAEIDSASAELSEIKQTYSKLKNEEQTLANQILEKQRFAEEVETAITERIKKAQDNAADFIANMAFVNIPKNTAAANSSKCAEISSAEYNIIQGDRSNKELDIHSNWLDAIGATALELEEAGVSSKYSNSVATFLCSAYIAKQPLLLVGPNAHDIVEALSAALFANKYGYLHCEGTYSTSLISNIGNSNEHIVLINNLISSGWIANITEITKIKDILFIATHPFPEDIQVEPTSIYNYVLPLFTEFFVDKSATGNYCGGCFAEKFTEYISNGNHDKERKIISDLNCNMLIKNKITNMLYIMHDLNDKITEDENFIFGILQYAYATMDMKTIAKITNDSNRHISNELKGNLYYILGDENE